MEQELGKIINEKIQAAMKERGHVNVLIAGRSGVGKSTMINAVFQGDIAETGQGRPVTKEIREYTKEGLPISIFDTRGLEMERYAETVAQLESLVKSRSSEKDPARHIHVAWVCILEDSRRVEVGEQKVAEMLSDHMPTIAVITKSRHDDGFRAVVQGLLPSTKNVISVRSLTEEDDEGNILKPKGLDKLVELTMEVLPEAHRNAFAAAQKASLAEKRKRAHLAVVAAAAAAGGVALAPIPLADAALLVPIQVGMLATISAIFGLQVTQAFLSTLIASAATALGATMAGRAIVASLLKFFPGAGSILGGAIATTTAVFVTTSFGEAYIAALVQVFEKSRGTTPSEAEIGIAFTKTLNTKKSAQ